MNGTLDAPAVRIEGSQITKNKIVGVGAMESRGIIIVSGRIADTIAAPLVTNLDSTEQVGDGVGIFAKSSDFKIDGSLFETNARAAGVIDGSERGIIIVSGKVGSGTGLKFVVQNSTGADVQIADADRSMPTATLGVSAPKLTVPSVLWLGVARADLPRASAEGRCAVDRGAGRRAVRRIASGTCCAFRIVARSNAAPS